MAWFKTQLAVRKLGAIGIFEVVMRKVRAEDETQAREFAMDDCHMDGLEVQAVLSAKRITKAEFDK